jgi:hypothetical protein
MRGLAGGLSSTESAERDEIQESGERPESSEADLKQKCEELSKMKEDLLKTENELKNRLDELRRCLHQLEGCQPNTCPSHRTEEIPRPLPEVHSFNFNEAWRGPNEGNTNGPHRAFKGQASTAVYPVSVSTYAAPHGGESAATDFRLRRLPPVVNPTSRGPRGQQ